MKPESEEEVGPDSILPSNPEVLAPPKSEETNALKMDVKEETNDEERESVPASPQPPLMEASQNQENQGSSEFPEINHELREEERNQVEVQEDEIKPTFALELLASDQVGVIIVEVICKVINYLLFKSLVYR